MNITPWKNSFVLIAAALVLTLPSFATDKPAQPEPAMTASATKNLLAPTVEVKAWQFELNEDATGNIKVEDGAIALTAAKVDGTDWHIQAYQMGIELKEGGEYVVSFKARASSKRAAQLYAGVNEDDYHSVGLDEPIDLTPKWNDFKIAFKAEGVAGKNNRLGFIVGQEIGTVFVKDLVLTAK